MTAFTAVMALGITGWIFEWPQRAWHAAGFSCGQGIDQADPAEFTVPLDAVDDDDSATTLAAQFDAVPQMSIPSTYTAGSDGQESSVRSTAAAVGDSLLVSTRNSDDEQHHLALIDPATADVEWVLDVWDADPIAFAVVDDRLAVYAPFSRDPAPYTPFNRDSKSYYTDVEVRDLADGDKQDCIRLPGEGRIHTDMATGPHALNLPQSGSSLLIPSKRDQEAPSLSSVDIVSGTQEWQIDLPAGYEGVTPRNLDEAESLFVTSQLSPDKGHTRDLTSTAYWERERGVQGPAVQAHAAVDGEPVWEYSGHGETAVLLDTVPTAFDGEGGVLVLDFGQEPPEGDDEIDVTVTMLDAAGETVWSREGTRDRFYENLVAVWDETVVMVDADDRLVGIDAGTGEELWELDRQELPDDEVDLRYSMKVDRHWLLNNRGLGEAPLIDPRTGEQEGAIEDVDSVWQQISALGADHLLLEQEEFRAVVFARN